MVLPDAIASVFSSSWASLPIQTNTFTKSRKYKMHDSFAFPLDAFFLFFSIVSQMYCSPFLTCSQVSRIMTSSVARSSWVSSPGTSSIWKKNIDWSYMWSRQAWLKSGGGGGGGFQLTMKFPVLLEQAKSLGGWASILSRSLVEVRYSVFPPRASQNWPANETHALTIKQVLWPTHFMYWARTEIIHKKNQTYTTLKLI